MSIRLGTLLPGAVEVGFGANKPKRGFALMQSGQQEMIIFKRVSAPGLAAEVFCAVLGRATDLTIPEPVIVKDPSSGSLLFGSIFADYPNLLQAFNLDPDSITEAEERVIASRVVQWTKIDDAVVFDEWVNNVDRTLRNVLWDGFDHFVLIDHELCLGLHRKGRRDENWLLKLALIGAFQLDKAFEKFKARVLDAALECDAGHANEAAKTLREVPYPSAAENSQEFFTFVTKRIPELAARLAKRFPSRQLTLEV
jgi:hypothetical protein